MLSFPEILIILLVAVIVFGPKRLPEVARKIGRWSGMLRRAGDEFKRQLMTMDQAVDQHVAEATRSLDEMVPTDEMEQSLQDAFTIPEGEPPTWSDELGEPVPGGLPTAPEAPEAAPATTESHTTPPDFATLASRAQPVPPPAPEAVAPSAPSADSTAPTQKVQQ